jgi:HD-GYP domain-containing protein (c-di-GMP phosphodiesterase class II)/HAMP domain-containing protein
MELLPEWKLLVYQPYRRISAEVHSVGKRITLVALLALAAAVILGFYRAHRVVTPITKLLNATDEISEGNYSQRVAVDSRDEIGKFAFAFNRMTASLEEKIKELKESQTHLEEAYNQLKTDSVKREETTRELHRKVEELVSLSELTRTVTTTNPEKVFETIRDIINRVMGFDACSIKLYDSKASVLRLQIASGLGEEYLSKNDTPITEGISGLALKMCQPIAVEDLDTDTRIPHDHVLRHIGIKSLITVPLITKQGPVGVMNLYTHYHHTFTEDEKRLLDIFANQAASAIESSRLFESLRESYLNTIRALSTAIDAKDQYTHGHSKRVSEISLIVGEQMDLSKKELELLQYAGDLHDLGKIGISEVIISKEGKLTPEEYEIMKTHPLVGETIIEPVPFLQEIRSVVRCHHEHYNGYGYPDGLKGDEIPLLSRILHIADAYDAMTSDRPYRRSLSHEMAIREIKKHSGNQFDPKVVETFLAVLEYKTPEQVLWERETEGRRQPP